MKRMSIKGIICFFALLLSPVTLLAVPDGSLQGKGVNTSVAAEQVRLAAHGGGRGWRGGGRGLRGGGRGLYRGGRGWHGGGRVWRGGARGWHGGGRVWRGSGRGWYGGRGWPGGWVGGVWYAPGVYPPAYYGRCRTLKAYRKVCRPVCYWSQRYKAERCRTKCYTYPYWIRRCW